MAATIIVTSILGILSGLGVGGGSLLMIWLTVFTTIDYSTARTINLLFFIPPAAFSTVYHFIKKDIPYKPVVLASIAGCSSAALFSRISQSWNTDIIRKLFGFLLLAAALREFRFKAH